MCRKCKISQFLLWNFIHLDFYFVVWLYQAFAYTVSYIVFFILQMTLQATTIFNKNTLNHSNYEFAYGFQIWSLYKQNSYWAYLF